MLTGQPRQSLTETPFQGDSRCVKLTVQITKQNPTRKTNHNKIKLMFTDIFITTHGENRTHLNNRIHFASTDLWNPLFSCTAWEEGAINGERWTKSPLTLVSLLWCGPLHLDLQFVTAWDLGTSYSGYCDGGRKGEKRKMFPPDK